MIDPDKTLSSNEQRPLIASLCKSSIISEVLLPSEFLFWSRQCHYPILLISLATLWPWVWNDRTLFFCPYLEMHTIIIPIFTKTINRLILKTFDIKEVIVSKVAFAAVNKNNVF